MSRRNPAAGTSLPKHERHGTRTKPDTSNSQALQVLQKFRLIFRSVKKHFRWVEERCGVSGAQLWAMFELAQNPGLRVSDIARALSIHQSTASNMLDKLEKRELIERRREGQDRRVVSVFLTKAGNSVIERAPRPARGVLTDALGNLPDEALQNLEASLDLLIREMKITNNDDAMHPLSDL